MNEQKITVWRIRVGNLYYVQGLKRFIKSMNQDDFKNVEMTTYKDAAFLFFYEEVAGNIAEIIGGVVEPVELKSIRNK